MGSANAKQMQADMYTRMFKNATDLDHPCRVSGSTYLRCLQENFKDTATTARRKCTPNFSNFDGCRKNVLQQQADALESSMVRHDIGDRRAKALFERRAILLDSKTAA